MQNSQKEYELYSSLLLKSTFEEINNSMLSTLNDENSNNSEFSLLNITNSNNESLTKDFQNEKNEINNINNYYERTKKDSKTYLKYLFVKGELTVSKIEEIIPNLKGKFFHLMNGRNSNYLMSELIKNASKKQKLSILSEIYNQIDILAINEYGSHP